MKNNSVFTKILATAGTTLLLIPILTPIIFSLIRLFQVGNFMFDYLMPAELFPLVLIGGTLLVWAAIRTRSRLKSILLALVLSAGLLVLSQGSAVMTGLASGRTARGGWQEVLTLGLLIGSVLAIIATGILGIQLVRDVFRKPRMD
jgi:hypothetical protein